MDIRVLMQPRGCDICGLRGRLGPEDGLIIGPAFSVESAAAKAIYLMLIVLAIEGLGVERNDGDLAPMSGLLRLGGRVKTTTGIRPRDARANLIGCVLSQTDPTW